MTIHILLICPGTIDTSAHSSDGCLGMDQAIEKFGGNKGMSCMIQNLEYIFKSKLQPKLHFRKEVWYLQGT